MARAALSWTISDVAAEARIGRATVARFELEQSVQPGTIQAMRSAYEAWGITFMGNGEASLSGGAGVRLVASSD